MDKFNWLELTIPILCSGLLSLAIQLILLRLKKRGYLWGFILAAFAFFVMIMIWVYVGRYTNQMQCEIAYGDLGADPKMCDNPASGLMFFIEFPFIILAWLSISAFTTYRLRPLNTNTTIT